MRKNRWISVSLALVLGFAAVASAACTQEPTEPLTKTAYPFRDLSAAFIDEETQSETPQIVTYFKQGSSIPYVGVEAFFAALHGWSEMPDLGNVVSEAESSYILYNKKDATDYILADWKEDTLSVSSTEFLQMAAGESTEGSYVDSTAVLSTWETGDQGTTFDLGAYGFDILYADGQLLLPVCIANLLFCSTRLYNVYFNGEEYFGMSQSDANSFSAARWEELRTCDWNNTTASAEMRQTTVNFLNFALDSFYGLKEEKGIGSFGGDVITGELRTALLSQDAATFDRAYVDLFHRTLNELHSYLITPSFFSAPDATYDLFGEDSCPAMTEFNELYLTLSMDMSERLGEETSQPDGSTSRTIPILRYVDDTAVLIVTSFMSGTEEQIYNDDKTISDTAYQYDTFYFVQRAMQAIKAYEAEGHSIENVVLDLTLNSGGSLAAMTGVIGCMTDLPVVYPRADLLSDRFSIDYYLTDADGDGDYKDADAYDEYDWYVLTSPLTFSAANFLASVVQDMGVATVIGEQSAGGTCALLTIVLPDGATTNISGALHVMQSPVYEQGVIVGGEMIEDGITPDILLDRQSFYDNTALIEAIHNAKQ